MAVLQISRIQIRRGKANSGTGIPQLASGELAWALDTQELYIGNGAVAEGSPAVGNTKILTELDLSANGNVLNLIQHIYKIGSSIQTGPTANDATGRTLQQRFDDRVTTADFGAIGDSITDDTAALQRAIDQLFLNTSITKSSDDTADGVQTRVTLEVPPGIYNVTSTLYVPSYATLIGAGADKTILSYTGTGPVIQFVNDTSNPGSPDEIGNTQYNTQPRNIILSGLTIYTDSYNQPGLQLDAVRDSLFNNLIVKGNWAGTVNTDSKGIIMNAVSSLVTTERNLFNNVVVSGFTSAVYAKQDILGNTFKDCYITDVQQGFVLGQGASGTTVGEQYGPRNTLITNCRFEAIKQQAVFLKLGSGTSVRDSKLINVGNNSRGTGGNITAQYPQIYFDTHSNKVDNVESDRANDLANPTVGYNAVPYVPEVAGHGEYSSFGTRQLSLGQVTNYTLLFRLPVSTDYVGTPWRDISYDINYVYRSINGHSNLNQSAFSRRGSVKIIADITNSVCQLVDEYDVTGISELDSLKLELQVHLLDSTGTIIDPTNILLGQVPYSIAVTYRNILSNDAGYFVYSYNSTF